LKPGNSVPAPGYSRLSEQHPREQGLKQEEEGSYAKVVIGLSEQHPREQGLKRIACTSCTPPGAPFQSNIQENKD